MTKKNGLDKTKDMGVTVNIPKNDYVQPTEVRQEIVQGICDAFLGVAAWKYFHPSPDGCYRDPTTYITRRKGESKFYGFINHRTARDWTNNESVRFNGAEMKAAFNALRKAGYHIFKVYVYGTWKAYVCEKKTYREGGNEVFSFDDFID